MLGLVLRRHSVVDTKCLQKLLLKDNVAESVGTKWFVKSCLSVDIRTSALTTDHILPEDIALESSKFSMGFWRKSLSVSASQPKNGGADIELFPSQFYKWNSKQYLTWLDGEWWAKGLWRIRRGQIIWTGVLYSPFLVKLVHALQWLNKLQDFIPLPIQNQLSYLGQKSDQKNSLVISRLRQYSSETLSKLGTVYTNPQVCFIWSAYSDTPANCHHMHSIINANNQRQHTSMLTLLKNCNPLSWKGGLNHSVTQWVSPLRNAPSWHD